MYFDLHCIKSYCAHIYVNKVGDIFIKYSLMLFLVRSNAFRKSIIQRSLGYSPHLSTPFFVNGVIPTQFELLHT
jgi:hypothetical protein